ncbi:hypothetical protein [Lysobacter sp. D1-1-M9]
MDRLALNININITGNGNDSVSIRIGIGNSALRVLEAAEQARHYGAGASV